MYILEIIVIFQNLNLNPNKGCHFFKKFKASMSNVKITSIRSCKKNKYKYIFELVLPSSCNEKKIDYLKYSNEICKKLFYMHI